MADRGQSEVIGFVLVFALVVSTVSLASAAGFAGLEDARDYERSHNAEQAFAVLANGIDDVAYEGAPSRQVEMVADDAQVFVGDPVTITVAVAGGGTESVTVRPIVYQGPDGSRLIYTAGAVIREDPDGAVMIRHPDLVLSDERTVVRIVQTRTADGANVGGATVRVRADGVGDSAVFANTTTQDVTITVESPRAGVWERYFASNDDLDCTETADAVTCEVKSDAVHVTVSEISVGLS
ncbi:MAG: DUF7289 family protein [Halobacteriota archaeon]